MKPHNHTRPEICPTVLFKAVLETQNKGGELHPGPRRAKIAHLSPLTVLNILHKRHPIFSN